MRPGNFSLRLLIPVISILILVFTTSIAYVASNNLSKESSISNTQNTIRNKLNYIQGAAEQLIRKGMNDILYQLISSIASEPDLLNILIVDQHNKVLASNNFSDVGKKWRQLGIDFDEGYIQQSKQQKKTLVKQNLIANHIEGYVSICNQAGSQTLRSAQCGFAVYRVNLAYHFSQTSRALNLQTLYFSLGIIISFIAIFVLMKAWVNKPVLNMIKVLSAFNHGHQERRIAVKRNNEITKVSKAINRVLDTVVKNEKTLKEKEARFRAIFDNTIDAIMNIDKQGIIHSVNPATTKMLGYEADELTGKNISVLTPEPHRSQHDQFIKNYLEQGKGNIIGKTRELNALTKHGLQIPIALTVTEMSINGEVFFSGIIRDISEQIQLRESMFKRNNDLLTSNLELKKISKTDPLTGIANRGHFDEALMLEYRRAIRQGLCLSLILLDVDYFKLYNDYYGHTQGDECLQSISKAMKLHFQTAGGLAARYGGEEFGVILPNMDNKRAFTIAEQIRQKIWHLNIPHEKSKIADRITISVGVTTLELESKNMITIDELVNSADKALYQAKSIGRNQVVKSDISNEKA